MKLLQHEADTVVASVTPDELRQRIKRKSRLKGRQPDDAALAEVRALLGAKPATGWPVFAFKAMRRYPGVT